MTREEKYEKYEELIRLLNEEADMAEKEAQWWMDLDGDIASTYWDECSLKEDMEDNPGLYGEPRGLL